MARLLNPPENLGAEIGVGPGSDTEYWELLSYLWRSGEDFAVVEHDIVVSTEILDSFDTCPQEWCTASYHYLRGTYWGLGCTRFRAGLMARVPDLLDQIADWENPKHPPKHWCTLDNAISTSLRRITGAWPHQDHGEVEHLSDGLPTHGCRA